MKKSITFSTLTLILAIGVVQTVAQDYIVQVDIMISAVSFSAPESESPLFFSRTGTPDHASGWHDRSSIDRWSWRPVNPLPGIDRAADADRLINTRMSNSCPVMSDREFHQIKLEKVLEKMPVHVWQPPVDWVRPATDWRSNPGMQHLLHDGAGIRIVL